MFSNSLRSLFLAGFALVLFASPTLGQELEWKNDLDLAKQQAAKEGKLVLLHFYADWCGPCKQLDTFVFNRKIVAQKINENLVPVKIHSDAHPDLMAEYNIKSIPFDVAITPNGNLVHRQRSPSSSDNYLAMIERLGQMNGRVAKAGTQVAQDSSQFQNQFQNRFQERSNQDETSSDSMSFNSSPVEFKPDRRSELFADQKGQFQSNPTINNDRSSPASPQFVKNQHVTEPAAASNGDFQTAPRKPDFQTIAAKPVGSQASGSSDFQGARTPANPTDFQPRSTSPSSSATPQRIVNHNVGPMTEGVLEPVFTPKADPTRPAPQALATAQRETSLVPMNAVQANAVQKSVAQQNAPQKNAWTPPAQPKSIASNLVPQRVATTLKPKTKPVAPPSFALNGNCPVSLLTISKWVPGNKKFGCVHRGKTYLFASKEHMETFLSDPDRYSPVLAGFDPVAFADQGELNDGKESLGVFMSKAGQQKIVLFESVENRDKFQKSPKRYLEAVRVATERIDTTTIRR